MLLDLLELELMLSVLFLGRVLHLLELELEVSDLLLGILKLCFQAFVLFLALF